MQTSQKIASICALVAALSAGACKIERGSNYGSNHPSSQEHVQPGDYTFNLVQFVPKKGVHIRTEELGTLVQTEESTLDLNAGGTEKGSIDIYDFDGNRYPDAMVFRRANGEIVSIGLDYGSKNYWTLRSILGRGVTEYDPSK